MIVYGGRGGTWIPTFLVHSLWFQKDSMGQVSQQQDEDKQEEETETLHSACVDLDESDTRWYEYKHVNVGKIQRWIIGLDSFMLYFGWFSSEIYFRSTCGPEPCWATQKSCFYIKCTVLPHLQDAPFLRGHWY